MVFFVIPATATHGVRVRKSRMFKYICTSEVSHGFIKLKPNLWLAAPGDAEKIEGAYRIFYSTAENLKHNVEKCPSNSKFIYEYVDHIDAKIVGSQKRLEKPESRL